MSGTSAPHGFSTALVLTRWPCLQPARGGERLGEFSGFMPRVRSYFEGKRVLVTGAAGWVGQGLCLRLAVLGCAELAVLDRFDHGLLAILEKLERASPQLHLTDALCDVRDAERIGYWLNRIGPDVVIHAAALNHVQLAKRHIGECVLTNLVGVRNVAESAMKAGASQFILISSSEAAATTCALGVSRLLAELLLSGLQREQAASIEMKSVRGALESGDPAPVRYRAQTDRHVAPDTADPGALWIASSQAMADLVLGVASVERRSGVYVKKTGDPISAGDDGPVVPRPGEQDAEIGASQPANSLANEHWSDEFEQIEPSDMGGVLRVTRRMAHADVTSSDVERLEAIARANDDAATRQHLFALHSQCLQRGAPDGDGVWR